MHTSFSYVLLHAQCCSFWCNFNFSPNVTPKTHHISEILYIYLTYLSGKEPIGSIRKGETNLGSWLDKSLVCHVPIRFATAWGFLLVRMSTLAAHHHGVPFCTPCLAKLLTELYPQYIQNHLQWLLMMIIMQRKLNNKLNCISSIIPVRLNCHNFKGVSQQHFNI